MTEAEFQRWVIAEANARRIIVGHDPDSRGQTPGEPDLYLLGRRLVWAELKAPRGILRDEQRRWHNAAVAAGQEVYIWCPGDEAEVLAVLDGIAIAPARMVGVDWANGPDWTGTAVVDVPDEYPGPVCVDLSHLAGTPAAGRVAEALAAQDRAALAHRERATPAGRG